METPASKKNGKKKRDKRGAGPGQFAQRSGTLFRLLAGYIRQNRAIIKSLLIFAGCILLFVFLYGRIDGSEQLLGFRSIIASITSFILGLFSLDIEVIGTSISSPDFSMGIITACTGLISMGIFAAAVLAFPASISRKAEGIFMGLAVIFIVNLLRMVGLFLVGAYLPGLFESAHYIVGQSLMILLAIGLWLLWMEKRVHATSQ